MEFYVIERHSVDSSGGTYGTSTPPGAERPSYNVSVRYGRNTRGAHDTDFNMLLLGPADFEAFVGTFKRATSGHLVLAIVLLNGIEDLTFLTPTHVEVQRRDSGPSLAGADVYLSGDYPYNVLLRADAITSGADYVRFDIPPGRVPGCAAAQIMLP